MHAFSSCNAWKDDRTAFIFFCQTQWLGVATPQLSFIEIIWADGMYYILWEIVTCFKKILLEVFFQILEFILHTFCNLCVLCSHGVRNLYNLFISLQNDKKYLHLFRNYQFSCMLATIWVQQRWKDMNMTEGHFFYISTAFTYIWIALLTVE